VSVRIQRTGRLGCEIAEQADGLGEFVPHFQLEPEISQRRGTPNIAAVSDENTFVTNGLLDQNPT
jgi:hypothetical protein